MLLADEEPTNEACGPVEEPSLRLLYVRELKHLKPKIFLVKHYLLDQLSCAENCGHRSPVLLLCRPATDYNSTKKSFPDLDDEKLWLPLQFWTVLIVEPPEHVPGCNKSNWPEYVLLQIQLSAVGGNNFPSITEIMWFNCSWCTNLNTWTKVFDQ